MRSMLKEVISGGQTGIDRFGLEEAKRVGILTGGMAPRNYWTEIGSDFTLKEVFGLLESPVNGYVQRTRYNVKNSDGTVLFGDMTSVGSYNTIQYCQNKAVDKPYIVNPTPQQLYDFILEYEIEVLNVAGNRGSKVSAELEISTRNCLSKVFDKFKPKP